MGIGGRDDRRSAQGVVARAVVAARAGCSFGGCLVSVPDCQQCDDTGDCPWCVAYGCGGCPECGDTGSCARCGMLPEKRGQAEEPGIFGATQAGMARAIDYWADFEGEPEAPGLAMYDASRWPEGDGPAPELGGVAVAEGSALQGLLAGRREEKE